MTFLTSRNMRYIYLSVLILLFCISGISGDTKKNPISSSTVKKEIIEIRETSKKEIYFVASRKAEKYHRPSCINVKKILPKNLIKFSSVEEATMKGYKPCKICLPPGE